LEGLEGQDAPEEGGPSGDIPEWLREDEEVEPDRPEPTRPNDWEPVETAQLDAFTMLEAEMKHDQDKEAAAAAKKSTASEEETEAEPAADGPPMDAGDKPQPDRPASLSTSKDPLLNQAQSELSQGNISASMEEYGKLIKKGRLLEEAIFDLREALYRFPVEVTIWQTLGDAYMRANRLQDALDSYTKAEELLR
jgi:tetratricopeptide (TPR) repeat protein